MTTIVCKCEGYTYITYENYCLCVEEIIAEKKLMNSFEKNKFKNILNFLKIFKDKITLHLKQMGISFKDLVIAMLKKDFYTFLHLLKFNIYQLLQALGSLQKLINQGLLKILSQLAARSNRIKIHRERLILIDQFLDKYSILKHLIGPTLAAFLIWYSVNSTFIGDYDTDFNSSNAIDALVGNFSLYDLFGSDEGLLSIVKFFTGITGLINFNWMVSHSILALICVVYGFNKNETWAPKIKIWFRRNCQKVSPKVYSYVTIEESNRLINMDTLETKSNFDINTFVKTLKLRNWFTRLGKIDIGITTNLKYTNSLDNAILIWDNNTENRNDELEQIKLKLMKNETWLNSIDEINTAILNELKSNAAYNSFIRNVIMFYKELNKNKKIYTFKSNELNFYSLTTSMLPIIGYFGEMLIDNNAYNYYTKEIEYFKKGHFVVEHIDNKFLLY